MLYPNARVTGVSTEVCLHDEIEKGRSLIHYLSTLILIRLNKRYLVPRDGHLKVQKNYLSLPWSLTDPSPYRFLVRVSDILWKRRFSRI